MLIEVIILGVLLFIILQYNGTISVNKFVHDNQDIFMRMKENDFDFYARAKYGDSIDTQKLLYSSSSLIGCIP